AEGVRSSRGKAIQAVATQAKWRLGEELGRVQGVVNRLLDYLWQVERYPERPVAPTPPQFCAPGQDGFKGGLSNKDALWVVPLTEQATQLFTRKREVLCLTGAGLHTLVKLRPVDHLYNMLASHRMSKVEEFFHCFSPDQAAAMCFSIACGLPRDAGARGHTSTTTSTAPPPAPPHSPYPEYDIQSAAINAILTLGEPAKFSNPQTTAV
ncbi:unnamed protein product, partial [Discosporangium mesarthrocarpum]